MPAASKLIRLFLLFCRFLVKSIKGSSALQALNRILRRLTSYTFGLNLGWCTSTHKTPSTGPVLPPSTSAQLPEKSIGKSDGRRSKKEALDPELSYITVVDGETIPSNDIMPSVYPLSGSGIHNGSRTSMNLQASRSAHSLNIQSNSRNVSQSNSRNTSQSNLAAGPDRPESFFSSNAGVEENYTIIVQDPDPGSPTTPSPPSDGIALTFLPHSPRLHPRDTHTGPLLQTELFSITTPTISLAHGEGYLRSGSVSTLNVERVETTSTRPSSSIPDNSQTTVFDDTSNRNVDDSHVDSSTHNGIEIAPSMTQPEGPSFTPRMGNDRITPVMPEAIKELRYKKRPTIPKERTDINIQPLVISFQNRNPEGWMKITHPEGVRYFWHWEKAIFTEANLHDEEIYKQIMEDIETIERHRVSIDRHDILGRNHADLVIHTFYDEEKGGISTCYYYTHRLNRSIVFLDDYSSASMSVREEIYGPTSVDHLRHEIEAQYWFHVQLYPHAIRLTKEMIAELRDVALHFIGDTMTSPTSTAPYSIQDLQDLLKLTEDMDKNVGMPPEVSVGAQSLLGEFNLDHNLGIHDTDACVAARQMYIFARSKYLHFHGEPHARVERNFSVYGDNATQRTWLVRSLSPLLFFAPDFHLTNLQNMWTDHIMHKSVFRESMKKMNEEWDHFVLFATVMLNANVAFLAIQSVDNNESPQRSAAQISSYVSMFASIGSIVLGLHLSRQNKTKGRDNIDSIDEVQKYMENRAHPRLGLETLAILYGLPYALLIWGMVSFFLAVALVCFMKSDTPTRTIIGFCCSSSIVLIIWCIQTNWEKVETGSALMRNHRKDLRNTAANDSSSLHKTRSNLLPGLPILSRGNSNEGTAV